MKSDRPKRRRKRAAEKTVEHVFDGLGVSPGIGIGQVHLVESGAVTVSEYEIPEDGVEAELERFRLALQKSERQLRKLMGKASDLHGAAAEELGFLLDAHLQMITGSRVVRGVQSRIEKDRLNAEAAVQSEISRVAEEFASLHDAYLAARASDVREVGNRLLRNLTKTPFEAFKNLPAGSIVVAEELSPADTALLDPKTIEGFATALGGKESHTAIMARSLGLPAVLGLPDLLRHARTGQTVIVDGNEGRVILNPSPARLAEHRRRQDALERDEKPLARFKRLPAVRAAPCRGVRPRPGRAGPTPASSPGARRLRGGRDPGLPADRPARQSRAAARGSTCAQCGRRGCGPAAHRVPVHEPG